MNQTSKPNVLLLFTDDQRFNTIHALNNDEIHTPVIDCLVRDGLSFENAYIMGGTCEAVCMPSRAMLHTGRSLFSLRNSGAEIPTEHVLLGEHFRKQGYKTFGTGKWHNGIDSYVRSFADGGEIFFGGMDDHWNVPACDFSPTGRYPQARPRMWNPGTGACKEIEQSYDHIVRGKHSTELFSDEAIRFLLKHDTSVPFFMYVSFMAPHDPRTMPQRFLSQYNPHEISLPENFMEVHPFDNGEMHVRDEQLSDTPRAPAEIRRHLAEYYAMITHLDYEIGRVLDALKAAGQYDKTIVVLAGDNGLALGSHGLMGKQNNYDHSVHVPLILSGPGIPTNEKRNSLCYLLDVFPTLCELCGLSIPNTVEGKSLVPCLTGGGNTHRSALLFAYRHLQRSVLIEDGWKLIEYFVGKKRRTQLFDRSNDPLEMRDLFSSAGNGERITALRTLLRDLRNRYSDPLDIEL